MISIPSPRPGRSRIHKCRVQTRIRNPRVKWRVGHNKSAFKVAEPNINDVELLVPKPGYS